MRRAAWVCKLLGTLEGRCFWNPGLLFGFSWQSGCRAHLNARGTARSGRGQPGMPSLGSWVQHQSSLGHSEPTPKGPGVSWWEPRPAELHRQGPGIAGSGNRSQEGSRYPRAHHMLPMWPGIWEEVPGASTGPVDM